MQDQWVTDFIALIKEVTEIMGSGFVSDFFPSLKFLDKAKFAAMDKAYDIMFGHIENEFEEHKKTLDAGTAI